MRLFLSFDDGRDDFYDSYKILVKYKLTASFHITTGFIDKTFKTNDFGIDRHPLKIKEIYDMYKNKMDISSHGDKHIMDANDFKNSFDKLNKWLERRNKIGFSIPNSKYSNIELHNFYEANKNHLSYIRAGRSQKCYKFGNKVSYVLYHITKMQCFYNIFNKMNIINNNNKFEINSIVIKNDVNVKNVIKFIEKYKNVHCNIVLMFHSIVNNPNNKWEYKKSDFEQLCSYISLNKIQTYKLEDF